MTSQDAAARSFYDTIHPLQQIEWPNKKQRLEYRTCGCADSCWTAQLWDISRKKRKLLASLRCDCESIWAKVGNKKEYQHEKTCDVYGDMSKMTYIRTQMQELIKDIH